MFWLFIVLTEFSSSAYCIGNGTREGNILISREYPNLRMNLLDCGLVVEMGPEQHVNLVKVLGAFTRKDGTLAGNLMVDLKSETQAGPEDIALFVRGIEQICEMDAEHVSTLHALSPSCFRLVQLLF